MSSSGFPWGANAPPFPLGNPPNLPMNPTYNTMGNGSIVDRVPADLLHLIDPFWYQFPPMNPAVNYSVGLVALIIGIAAVSGNFVVLYVFLSTRNLRTPANMLIVNLAFSDFMMMAGMFPFLVVSCFNEVWIFGQLMCELHGFIGAWFGCQQIWSLTLIAKDRYNVIVKGIGSKPLSFKKVALMLFFVDGFALAWGLVPFFGWNRYVPEGNMTVCGSDSVGTDAWSRSYIFVIWSYAYFVPLSTIIYCYFHIVKAVAAHERQMREQAQKMNVQSLRTGDDGKTSAEIRLAKVAIMTILLWFFAWTPYVVINFMGVFYRANITPVVTVWGSVFAKISTVYNPLVYGLSHPRYKAALNESMPCLSCIVGRPAECDDNKSVTTQESSDAKRMEQETAA
ncbi:unnamed protein product [Notodromas monacha]|uniref:G-protein coupled receptors family 1 profile domain-containing protein n=1 Tax=Notodromas monacha TaxID=399045 RepID=A0A7R9BN97_9CRUS|nr:unnamed protein product [Notodromas monacha]CAG0917550.1 unnamed protein product [Notodromas monacha]